MVAKDKRAGFDVRAFMEQHGLDRNVGGGAHMWREVWSEGVPAVYKDILSEFHKFPSRFELTSFQKLRSRSSGGCPEQTDMGILGGRSGMCKHWTGCPSVITREAMLHNQVIPVYSSHAMNSYLVYTETDSSASCVQALLLTHDQSS